MKLIKPTMKEPSNITQCGVIPLKRAVVGKSYRIHYLGKYMMFNYEAN